MNLACVENVCTCESGNGATGLECLSDGLAKCYSCDLGFFLENETCDRCVLLNPPESSRSYYSVNSNLDKSMIDSDSGWAAGSSTAGQWMQVDLGRYVNVSGLAIQGSRIYNEWVTAVTQCEQTDKDIFCTSK